MITDAFDGPFIQEPIHGFRSHIDAFSDFDDRNLVFPDPMADCFGFYLEEGGKVRDGEQLLVIAGQHTSDLL